MVRFAPPLTYSAGNDGNIDVPKTVEGVLERIKSIKRHIGEWAPADGRSIERYLSTQRYYPDKFESVKKLCEDIETEINAGNMS